MNLYYKLSKHFKIFHKFDKYDLYSTPIVLHNFVMISFNSFIKNFSLSALNDFRGLYIWLHIIWENLHLKSKMKTKWYAAISIDIHRKTGFLKT